MSISDSDYEGKFTIPTPKGIYQAAGDTNINADYAYRAQNIRTERWASGIGIRHEPRLSVAGGANKTRRGFTGGQDRTTRTYTSRRQRARFTPTRWEQRAGSSGRRGTRAMNGAASPMKRRTAGRRRTF